MSATDAPSSGPDAPHTPSTTAAVRAAASRPARGKLTRLVTLLVVATCVSALASVATATLAVVSHLDARDARAAIDERIAAVAQARADDRRDAPSGAVSNAAWDALAPGEPIPVAQGEVDTALTNLTDLSKQARIVPAFENGRTVGFKLFSIEPGSLYARLGLQNGDVVRRINGFDMTSPEHGLEVYAKLRDAKTVRLDVSRRGEAIRIDYDLTP